MILAQLLGEKRAAEAAVTLADEEFRRGHAVVAAQPARDDRRQRVDIAVDRIIAVADVLLGADRAAVAGADRIDEDEVGEVEPGLGIGDDGRRRRRADARAVEGQTPRAEHAEMQIGRRGAGAAIDRKGDGPRARLGSVEPVGDEADLRLQPALRVAERQAAGRRREAQGAAGQIEDMLRDRIRRQPALIARAALLGLATLLGLAALGRPAGPSFFRPPRLTALGRLSRRRILGDHRPEQGQEKSRTESQMFCQTHRNLFS